MGKAGDRRWWWALGGAALVGGCVYDPVTGTYAMDPKALELISNIAVSSLTNSMSRGEKETVDRAEAREAAVEAQAVAMLQGGGVAAPQAIDAEGEFGAYTCGGHTVWLSACVVGGNVEGVAALDQLAAAWTAQRYATDNSLRWDGTPYRFAGEGGAALMLVRYDATTSDIGWVRLEQVKGGVRAFSQDGTSAVISPFDRTVFRWNGAAGCEVTLMVVNTGDGGVFWFDS